MAKMAVEFAGIKAKNPVFTASGTCGFGMELNEIFPIDKLGGIMVKGTTLAPRLGNDTPRIAETPSGVINCVGLQNPGLEVILQDYLPWVLQHDLAVLANIAGGAPEDYAQIATAIDKVPGVAGLEINISCPNVKAGGMAHGANPKTAAEVVSAVRKVTKLPLVVKLTPNVTDVTEIAKAVEAAGADAVSLVNTFLSMVIDVKRRKPLLGNVMGGLSGPAIRPIAVRMVYQVAQAVKIPVIGMGGITCGEDALQFMMAGASAVAVGAATMSNPLAPLNIIAEIEEWLDREGVQDVNEIVGAALPSGKDSLGCL
jgi:dihydroorotate dehydrogenase (NAD+) catalytic subunit